jgi:hypothetical protein
MPTWLNRVAARQRDWLGIGILGNQALFNSMKTLVQTSNGSYCDTAVTGVDN